LAKTLKISPRTLSDWKKGREAVYRRLKWSFEAENLLKDMSMSSDENKRKIDKLLDNK
jgi:hypothetical protein